MSKVKRQQVDWRREKVAELSAQGRTEMDIATVLKVSIATVSRDLFYLNKKARDNLQFHIQEHLPKQYQKCQNGLNQVLMMAWNTILNNNSDLNHTNRIQALSLISDCYKHLMDLSTNAGVISEAMKFVSQNQKKDQINQKEILNKLKIEAETETETNSIF
jgi:hypothetical protein